MIQELGDRPIDTTLFDPGSGAFVPILRTTWEELFQSCYIEQIGSHYRLTPKGWLLAIEASGLSGTEAYQKRLGHLLAVMKRHVKGRADARVLELQELARESGEPEGWIFNVIDSRASSSTGSARIGATWFRRERGRLVEIPAGFNLEPVDIASAMTVKHLERIEELEAKIQQIEEDRAQFHCPHCDAPIRMMHDEDFPDDHCIVSFEEYECGYATADGFEQSPCPYSDRWPELSEFEFRTQQEGNLWFCHPGRDAHV